MIIDLLVMSGHPKVFVQGHNRRRVLEYLYRISDRLLMRLVTTDALYIIYKTEIYQLCMMVTNLFIKLLKGLRYDLFVLFH